MFQFGRLVMNFQKAKTTGTEIVSWEKTASILRSMSFPCDWEKQYSSFCANSEEMEFVVWEKLKLVSF